MANKLTKRKYNNLLSGRNNYYTTGGQATIGSKLKNAMFKDGKVGFNNMTELGEGVTKAVGTAVGQLGGQALSGGMSSGVGSVMSGLGSIASAIPGPWGAVASAGLGLMGGITNRMFGSKLNEENIAKVQGNINSLNNFQSDASNFDALSQNWANAETGMTFDDSFIGKDGWFSNKAKDKAADLRRQIEAGNDWVQNSLNNNADSISTLQAQNLLANYAAFGGDLMTHGSNFDTGITLVGNGGTHETNPNEGVPMGVDQEGVPNLVEEGEVIFNDYVFSNRLKVPKAVRQKYKLRGNKSLTFADAALKMAKESEERPNDPISKKGLMANMFNLVAAQERLREQAAAKKFALGGNLYSDGSWMQTLNYDNSTQGLTFGQEGFNPYNADKTINWDIMYGADSPYTHRRNYVLDNWGSDTVKNWLPKYVESVNTYNKGRKGYVPLTVDGLTKDIFAKRTFDKSWGGMHAGIDLAGDPEAPAAAPVAETPRKTGKRMYLTGRKDPSGTPLEDVLLTDYDPSTGTYRYVKTTNTSEGDTDYTNVYYREPFKRTTTKQEDAYTPGDYPNYDNALRYMAPIGSAIGLGLTAFSKPDYSDAQAVLDASTSRNSYMPIRYKPIGNYLRRDPLDREFALNKLAANASATRRSLANLTGGNRAAATAGILAADYNYLDKVGSMIRQAKESDREHTKTVADFNKATDLANSQGFLAADKANQEAWSKINDFRLKGVASAAEMRSKIKLARDAAISANLSNLFNSLGSIGEESVNRKWRGWLAQQGVFAPVQGPALETKTPIQDTVPSTVEPAEPTKQAYGGKVKRRKRGLTI